MAEELFQYLTRLVLRNTVGARVPTTIILAPDLFQSFHREGKANCLDLRPYDRVDEDEDPRDLSMHFRGIPVTYLNGMPPGGIRIVTASQDYNALDG